MIIKEHQGNDLGYGKNVKNNNGQSAAKFEFIGRWIINSKTFRDFMVVGMRDSSSQWLLKIKSGFSRKIEDGNI